MPWLFWMIGAAVVGYALANRKTAPQAPPVAGPVGAHWVPVPRVNGNLIVPFGTLFAFRAEITDPTTPIAVAAATLANPSLGNIKTFDPGVPPPVGWPADDDGANAYRVTGTVTDPAGLFTGSPTARMWSWLPA